MADYAEAPAEIVAQLRPVCLGLPDAYEEKAWVGTRWRVRKRTFAHVLTIDSEWPPAYAKASAAEQEMCVVTFRAPLAEVDALSNAGHPFFKPRWGPDVLGMVLGDDVDWAEVAELLTESYCVLAPRKLVALVHRPTPD